MCACVCAYIHFQWPPAHGILISWQAIFLFFLVQNKQVVPRWVLLQGRDQCLCCIFDFWFDDHDDRRTRLIRKNSKSVQNAAHESGTKLLSEKSLLNTCKSNHFFEARYLWEHSTVCAQRVFTLGDSVNAEPAKTAGMHWRLGQTSVLEVKANVSHAGVLNCFEDNESQFASYSLTANRTNTASLEAVIGNVTSPDARYKERYFKMLGFFFFFTNGEGGTSRSNW